MSGCLLGLLLVLLLAAPFFLHAIFESIFTSLGFNEDIARVLGYATTFISFVALFWYYSRSKERAEKNVQALEKRIEEVLAEPLVGWRTGKLAGNNHPLIKSGERDLVLAVGERNFAILEHDTVTGVILSIEKVRANITTQSAVKGLNVFLFGVFALDEKEKLLVLDLKDPTSKEKYTCVFRGSVDFADIINKQRYLRITRGKENLISQEAE